MNKMEDTLLIFTDSSEESTNRPVTRGLQETVQHAAAHASAVAVSTLQENMVHFMTCLDTLLRASPKEVGGLSIEEVEIQVQIDAKGNVGIASFIGAETSTQGGLKFVLRKKIPPSTKPDR
jgi:hypothetical protein